ncbi:hypothetical protein [Nostoc sp. C117]
MAYISPGAIAYRAEQLEMLPQRLVTFGGCCQNLDYLARLLCSGARV